MSDVDLALAAAASGGSGGNSPGETAVDDADAADQAAARRGERQRDPHPQPDAFVANILNRGPSLEKQLSLGFLDHMDSADIGEMVRDMDIGVGSAGSDEFTRRVDALSDVIKCQSDGRRDARSDDERRMVPEKKKQTKRQSTHLVALEGDTSTTIKKLYSAPH